MNYRTTCPHCGRVVTAYTLHMNEPLCGAFIAFCRQRILLGRPVKKGEIGLTNAQYSNFQNLRHFGLIAQRDKGGPWDVTPVGWAWLRGDTGILSPAAHMSGMTLHDNHPAWATHHTSSRRAVFIRDEFPTLWDQRPVFREQKIGAI